jgi:lipopolysaccharide heptosyltransferase II
LIENIKKLLIIRLSSLGDILLVTPMLRSINAQYPHISIDFLLRKEYKETLEYNPNISNLYTYSNDEADQTNLKQKLKSANYDLVIDLQNNFRSKRITGVLDCGVKRFAKKNLQKFLLVKFKINLMKNSGAIPQRYAETCEGAQLDGSGLEIYFKNGEQGSGNKDKNVIGLCPGSKHFTKMWPKEYYIELGRDLVKAGKTVHLIGGKSDREICAEISKNVPGAFDKSADDNLLQTAEEIEKCGVVVCNDSGLMHLACAVKTPVLVFFGSTVKEFGFAPYKNKNIILENNLLSCRPCSHIGRDYCPKGHFNCMKEITPSVVIKKMDSILEL